jgi:alkanesulfonate monooxygenase SsuD/methylene tetrahydromethanopterin reductase-like flavin-dependent oxidoreductase (luciferase family)
MSRAQPAGRKAVELGVLLPHFSDQCNHQRLLGFVGRIEALGFDSVWVRDNLSFQAHGFERPGMFVDPFVTLSAVAGRTIRLKLGTAVATPFRHPLVTAQLVGSLSWVSQGRFQLGIGPGTPRKPWELTGRPYEDRIVLCRETVEVIRAVARGPAASYHGKITRFDEATIDPAPPADLMVWYGGGSNASIRRALRYCDGIFPGLCPFKAWDVLAASARAQAAEQGRELRFASGPLVSVASSHERAVARIQPAIKPLTGFLERYYRQSFESLADLEGCVIAGTIDDVGEQLDKFVRHGAELVILDARLLMDEFEEVVEALGQAVLPAFGARRG